MILFVVFLAGCTTQPSTTGEIVEPRETLGVPNETNPTSQVVSPQKTTQITTVNEKSLVTNSVNSFYCSDIFSHKKCDLFSDNNFWVLGFIENPNNFSITNIQLVYKLYLENGTVLTATQINDLSSITLSNYIPSYIGPNDIMPFKLVNTNLKGIKNFTLTVEFDKSTDKQAYKEFSINSNISKSEGLMQVAIYGDLKNIGKGYSKSTEAIAVLYDNKGSIIDVLEGNILTFGGIDSNETEEFYIRSTYPDLQKIADYKVWVQGIVA